MLDLQLEARADAAADKRAAGARCQALLRAVYAYSEHHRVWDSLSTATGR